MSSKLLDTGVLIGLLPYQQTLLIICVLSIKPSGRLIQLLKKCFLRTSVLGLLDFECLNLCCRWTAAYRVYTNQAKGDLGELRQTLQRGIEVVRVLGNHGLDVKLIVHLAQTFEQRVSTVLCALINYP